MKSFLTYHWSWQRILKKLWSLKRLLCYPDRQQLLNVSVLPEKVGSTRGLYWKNMLLPVPKKPFLGWKVHIPLSVPWAHQCSEMFFSRLLWFLSQMFLIGITDQKLLTVSVTYNSRREIFSQSNWEFMKDFLSKMWVAGHLYSLRVAELLFWAWT